MKRTGFKPRTTTLKAKTPMKAKSAKKAVEKHPLRDNAKGQNCTLRLSQCRHDPEYTVLCHIRRNGWGGAGLKPHDLLAFFACDRCHEMEERHHAECTDADILRALGETLIAQMGDGMIKIKGEAK